MDGDQEAGVGGLSGAAALFYTLTGVRVAQVGAKCHCHDLGMSSNINFTSKEQKQ